MNRTAKPSFKAWLSRWPGQNAIGDLRDDVKQDRNWPGRRRTLKGYLRYLEECGACDGATKVMRRAWGEYQVFLTTLKWQLIDTPVSQ
jgi:hypothetical protein